MSPDPSRAASLSTARLAAHHAAALLADFAFTWIDHDPAFAFANLSWEGGALVTRHARSIRLGLELAPLTWFVQRGHERVAQAAVADVADPRAWLQSQAVALRLPEREIVGPPGTCRSWPPRRPPSPTWSSSPHGSASPDGS